MEISRRVAVCDPNGQVLYYAHREDVRRMIAAGQVDYERGINVNSVMIRGSLSSLDRPERVGPTQPSIRSYMGQSTTYTQRLDSGRVTQHKRIDTALAPIFRTAVTDCLA